MGETLLGGPHLAPVLHSRVAFLSRAYIRTQNMAVFDPSTHTGLFNWSALGPPSAELQQALWDRPGLTSLPTLTNGSPQRAAGTWERRLLRSFASGFLA